jgi:hypothetical protein
LHLALKPPQGILKRLALLNHYFCQWSSPQFRFGLVTCSACPQSPALSLFALSHEGAGLL